MYKTHKIRLVPNKSQQLYFTKACGCARFVYNWGLAEWNTQYLNKEKPNAAKLAKQFNSIKREKFPWILEVTKNAPQQAFKNLDQAFNSFFKGTHGYPRFKKKKFAESFRADGGQATVVFDGTRVRLPKVGWIKLTQTLRYSGKLVSVFIKKQGKHWYACVVVDVPKGEPFVHKNQGAVGVDLGVSTLMTLSTGEKIPGISFSSGERALLRRLNKTLSRRKPGSKRWHKARLALSKHYARFVNKRMDIVHKVTKRLVTGSACIVVETLNVRGLLRGSKLARHIHSAAFSKIVSILDYKSRWYDCCLLKADRWFPSSKLCSSCGYKLDNLPLSLRIWVCPCCGVEHDRDVNAAINLKNLAGSSPVTAHRLGSSGLDVGNPSETSDWVGTRLSGF